MKIFVATKKGQKKSKGDFCWCREGEPVVGYEIRYADSWVGVESLKATTTIRVAEVPEMTPEALSEAVKASIIKGGWAPAHSKRGLQALSTRQANENIRMAKRFKVGTILEVVNFKVGERKA